MDIQNPNSNTLKMAITKNKVVDFSVLPPENQISGTISFVFGFPVQGACIIQFKDGKISNTKQEDFN